MLYIAHRGNVSGPTIGLENTPSHIQIALDFGFHVEVDVWGRDGDLWLGHDAPTQRLPFEYVTTHSDRFFFHCKNMEALEILSSSPFNVHYFFHDTDDYTITSKGFIWCFPGKTPPSRNAIVVMPERFTDGIAHYLKEYKPYGVCSDYVNDLII